jgi:hypothetical protein
MLRAIVSAVMAGVIVCGLGGFRVSSVRQNLDSGIFRAINLGLDETGHSEKEECPLCQTLSSIKLIPEPDLQANHRIGSVAAKPVWIEYLGMNAAFPFLIWEDNITVFLSMFLSKKAADPCSVAIIGEACEATAVIPPSSASKNFMGRKVRPVLYLQFDDQLDTLRLRNRIFRYPGNLDLEVEPRALHVGGKLVLAVHGLRSFSGFLDGFDRKADLPSKESRADSRHTKPSARDQQKPKRPIPHIPLGLKIALTPLLLVIVPYGFLNAFTRRYTTPSKQRATRWSVYSAYSAW